MVSSAPCGSGLPIGLMPGALPSDHASRQTLKSTAIGLSPGHRQSGLAIVSSVSVAYCGRKYQGRRACGSAAAQKTKRPLGHLVHLLRKLRLDAAENLHVHDLDNRSHHHGGGEIGILMRNFTAPHRLDDHDAEDEIGICHRAPDLPQMLMPRDVDVSDEIRIFVEGFEDIANHGPELVG